MIDHKTSLEDVWISIEDKKKLLDNLRVVSKETIDEDNKNLLIFGDKFKSDNEEYYFDEDSNSLRYSGELIGSEGEIYVSFSLPLSDEVLIDILSYSVKKLNKLKTAIESLK